MTVVQDDLSALELAEAEAAAAEAEATAARARAEVARARARVAATRQPATASAPAKQRAPLADPAPPADDPEPDQIPAIEESDLDTTPESDESESPKDAEDADDKAPGRVRRAVTATRTRLAGLRRPSSRTLVVATMALITAAALAASGYIGWNHHQVSDEHSRAADFTSAAEIGVTAITSLDFRNAKHDVTRIVDLSTGEFYDDFKSRADDFTKVIEQSQVTTKGKVTGTAVESLGDDSATVLVSATSDVTNAAGAQQEPRIWRLRVTVQDVDGTMKIAKVEFVP